MSALFIPSISAAGLTLLTAADATAQLTALGGTAAIGTGGLVRAISPTFTTSINGGTTFTAFAGATTSLTIGGTGGSSEVIIPGTKEASAPTIAALRTRSLGVQGKVYIGGYLNLGTATWLLATTTNLTNYNGSDTITSIPNAPTGAPVGTVKWIAIDDSGVTRYIPTWELAPE